MADTGIAARVLVVNANIEQRGLAFQTESG